MQEGQLPF